MKLEVLTGKEELHGVNQGRQAWTSIQAKYLTGVRGVHAFEGCATHSAPFQTCSPAETEKHLEMSISRVKRDNEPQIEQVDSRTPLNGRSPCKRPPQQVCVGLAKQAA